MTKTKPYYFILGASDPEMEAIENLLIKRNIEYCYAERVGQRVHSSDAYTATGPAIDSTKHRVVFVECSVDGVKPKFVIDHHNPGDPGFGKPPSEAWEASSLGQVFELLRIPNHRKVAVAGYLWPARVVAAADHCLTAAYAGDVPLVYSMDVREYRSYVRSKFQGIDIDSYNKLLLHALKVVEDSPVTGPAVRDLRGYYKEHGPVREANEAAAQLGNAILYEFTKNGRTRVGCIGGSPKQILWFKNEFAVREKLTDVYGDPARGYAGGYR